jgi:hypothetical protein
MTDEREDGYMAQQQQQEQRATGGGPGRPMKPSDEGDPRGLDLARGQGDAYRRTVEHMVRDVAQRGALQRVGDYTIGYAVEKAEGMYRMRDGRLAWEEPDAWENLHIEVVVMDGEDGRFLPGLEVTATMLDGDGREIGAHRQPFLWHPYLFHYGRNWHLPGDGEYTLRIRVEPPAFPRHDKVNGNRYAEAAEAEFGGVRVRTGSD